MREALEGNDAQAREAFEFGIGEQLAFKLKRGLLGREQDQRPAVRASFEFGADFPEAAESFSAAGGAEEESRLHGGIVRGNARGREDFSFETTPDCGQFIVDGRGMVVNIRRSNRNRCGLFN